MSKSRKFVLLQVPADAWDTLHETLAVDTTSTAFDPKLRKEIRKALDGVKQVAEFEVTVGVDVERAMRYQLMWVEGEVEPSLVGDVCVGWDAFTKEIVRWLKYGMEDYRTETDGLFFVKLDYAGRLVQPGAFTNAFMDECRKKAKVKHV